ncbi:hypothetical protein INT45_004654 [Circinella minor]|uniref:Chromo domain-containing protein n=1 Tax=Circinella minor TaxID=1195481 RepID=A0A8H7RQ48_9FUNG|nr:hypothetical protein INT45_004654 [Circinella minor]
MEINDNDDNVISENEMEIDNNSSDSKLDVPKEYNRNKRKRNKGYDFNNDHFVYPIRKNINENLTITEEHFNNTFGSFRTKIKNQFSEIANKFYGFNNSKSIAKIDNIKFYNLQFRGACLLKNINKFVKLFNIPVLPHHKLWYSDEFDFPIEKKLINIVVSNDKQNKDKLDRMMQLQNNLLNRNISDNIMAVDNNSESDISINSEDENDVPNFNERSRKRRRNIKGKQRSTASYEIERIIGHKKENNIYLFQVKWVGYREITSSNMLIKK